MDELISKKDTLAKFDPVSDWSAYQIIKGMPSAEKTGHWIDGKCDKCGNHAPYLAIAASTYFINYTDYCPNCGARMVEPQESEVEG